MNKATAPRFPCLTSQRGETAYPLAFEFPRFTSRNKPGAFRIRNYRPKGNAKNISPGSSGTKLPPLAGCRLSSLQWADMVSRFRPPYCARRHISDHRIFPRQKNDPDSRPRRIH